MIKCGSSDFKHFYWRLKQFLSHCHDLLKKSIVKIILKNLLFFIVSRLKLSITFIEWGILFEKNKKRKKSADTTYNFQIIFSEHSPCAWSGNVSRFRKIIHASSYIRVKEFFSIKYKKTQFNVWKVERERERDLFYELLKKKSRMDIAIEEKKFINFFLLLCCASLSRLL